MGTEVYEMGKPNIFSITTPALLYSPLLHGNCFLFLSRIHEHQLMNNDDCKTILTLLQMSGQMEQ